jgi:hypothetical protein
VVGVSQQAQPPTQLPGRAATLATTAALAKDLVVAGRPGHRVRLRGGPLCYRASLQAPPVAVLLTLIRACDLATVIEADLDQATNHDRTTGIGMGGQWPGSPARPPPPSGPRRGH